MIPTTQTWRIGDTVELMREMDAESVDMIITSPPYWSLRNYGVDGQIGLEGTLTEYHRRLLEVTAECMRVLKPTGVMFWNHGDNYASSGGASRHKGYSDPKYPNGRTGDFNEPSAYPQGNIQPKSLFMQNERLIIRMIDEQGWILRNRIIWNKPNGMPERTALTSEQRIALEEKAIQKFRCGTSARGRRTPPRNPTIIETRGAENEPKKRHLRRV